MIAEELNSVLVCHKSPRVVRTPFTPRSQVRKFFSGIRRKQVAPLMKEVSVLGIAFDEANDVAAVILSREGARNVVPIPIDINEGITVIRLLQKRKMPRPMTHDLMMNIIGDLHHKVHKVEIDLADSGSYIASVEMSGLKDRSGTEPISLDARPFDAIAIAIKSEAPMFMSESAYDANSVPLVVEKKGAEGALGEEESVDEPDEEEFKDFLQDLKASDFNRLNRMVSIDDVESASDEDPVVEPAETEEDEDED